MPLIDRVAAKEKAFAQAGEWDKLIAYWDERERNRDRAYYSHKDSVDIHLIDNAELEDTDIMDLEKIYLMSKDNTCDTESIRFDYMNIQEIVSNPELAEALKTLTEKQKFVLYMTGVECFKTSEVAKMMGISARGVRSHLDAAKKRIWKHLGYEQAEAI